jgi:hypothetical protein
VKYTVNHTVKNTVKITVNHTLKRTVKHTSLTFRTVKQN